MWYSSTRSNKLNTEGNKFSSIGLKCIDSIRLSSFYENLQQYTNTQLPPMIHALSLSLSLSLSLFWVIPLLEGGFGNSLLGE